MIADVVLHFILGLIGTGAGCCAARLCRHRAAQVAVLIPLLLAEAVLAVILVG